MNKLIAVFLVSLSVTNGVFATNHAGLQDDSGQVLKTPISVQENHNLINLSQKIANGIEILHNTAVSVTATVGAAMGTGYVGFYSAPLIMNYIGVVGVSALIFTPPAQVGAGLLGGYLGAKLAWNYGGNELAKVSKWSWGKLGSGLLTAASYIKDKALSNAKYTYEIGKDYYQHKKNEIAFLKGVAAENQKKNDNYSTYNSHKEYVKFINSVELENELPDTLVISKLQQEKMRLEKNNEIFANLLN